MTSPLNVRATAEALGMTRERLVTRVNRLMTTFATVACPQIDDAGVAIPGAQQKVYLLDPLLGSLPNLIEPGLPMPPMSMISEAALAMTFARAVEAVHPGRLLEGRAMGYARTARGEIDFPPSRSGSPGPSWRRRPWRASGSPTAGAPVLGPSRAVTAAASSPPRASWTSTTPHGRCPPVFSRYSSRSHAPTHRPEPPRNGPTLWLVSWGAGRTCPPVIVGTALGVGHG